MRPPSRRERIAAQLADLKMPGALEALDGVLAGVDGGRDDPGRGDRAAPGRHDSGSTTVPGVLAGGGPWEGMYTGDAPPVHHGDNAITLHSDFGSTGSAYSRANGGCVLRRHGFRHGRQRGGGERRVREVISAVELGRPGAGARGGPRRGRGQPPQVDADQSGLLGVPLRGELEPPRRHGWTRGRDERLLSRAAGFRFDTRPGGPG